MENRESLVEKIISSVEDNYSVDNSKNILYSSDLKVEGNEFLMFLKPEALLSDIKIKKVLDVVLDKVEQFGLSISNVSVLSASYLKKHNIIAQHYGVINAIAKNAKENMSEEANDNFKKIFKKDVSSCNVLGGIEFLEKYSDFNALTFDYLWQNRQNEKLAGGTYCIDVNLDGEEVYIVNGFHPRQLLHFTEMGRSIVTISLCGDIDWATARQDLIGSTRPHEAKEGSLRNVFLKESKSFGFLEVSQGLNIVHLSAGPVEGLIELIRYNTDYESASEMPIDSYNFGKSLIDSFPQNKIDFILNNSDVNVDGKTISVFDLTEETNNIDAISKLKSLI